MNTDTLGGTAITLEEADAVDTSTTYVHGAARRMQQLRKVK